MGVWFYSFFLAPKGRNETSVSAAATAADETAATDGTRLGGSLTCRDWASQEVKSLDNPPLSYNVLSASSSLPSSLLLPSSPLPPSLLPPSVSVSGGGGQGKGKPKSFLEIQQEQETDFQLHSPPQPTVTPPIMKPVGAKTKVNTIPPLTTPPSLDPTPHHTPFP